MQSRLRVYCEFAIWDEWICVKIRGLAILKYFQNSCNVLTCSGLRLGIFQDCVEKCRRKSLRTNKNVGRNVYM